MPKKKPLDERQIRIIAKIGLLPLTSVRKISKRTGISENALMLVDRSRPNGLATKLALIEKFEKNPKTAFLLEHPKLWPVARIRELANQHPVVQIHKILVEEAAKKNSVLGRRAYTVPSGNMLWEIIRVLGLRSVSRSDLAIKSGIRRRRKPNALSPEKRQELLTNAWIFLPKIRISPRGNFSSEELHSAVMERLAIEVKFFEPKGKNFREISTNWEKFVNSRLNWFVVDALRRQGPFTRLGNQRRPASVADEKFEPAQRRPVQKSLSGLGDSVVLNLTPQEKEFLDLARRGLGKKEIAEHLGVGMSRLSQILTSVRGKASSAKP
ncbi:MAG: hypothetical protein PHH08_05265 [Candidatus ainarchaeum sp.]|nr:hypothetical protein [Candidatus ainarchaeum sp.]